MVKLKSQSELRKNIRLISFFFTIIFFIIAVRVYFLQILTPNEIRKRIETQHKTILKLAPRRGTIYDRNATELAVSIQMESLAARPGLINNARTVAKQLAPILGTVHTKLQQPLTAKKKFVWIRRKLSPHQSEKIKSLKIRGLEFVPETKRFYPNKNLAGQVLGFTGVDTQGLEGLEREYETILKGKQCTMLVDRDALGRHLFIEGIQPSGYIQGHDIILTIDKNIQYIAEKELQTALSLSQAKGGIAVVMDPWTGELLALAVAPLFNPNRFRHSSPDIWRNRAFTDMYEPGSTFKTFLMASALEEGLVKTQDIFFCENGAYRIDGKIIHDVHPHGWLDVSKILKVSSNIGASKISHHLGRQLFFQYIRKFGFGEETGIQFPTEAIGFVPLPYQCSNHTLSAISFGQGISVTPLQLTTAYAAIANGGLLMRPTLVKKITDYKGMAVQEYKPFVRRRVISQKTARLLNKMLQGVVGEGGTGTKASVVGFSIAGKTGTTQKLENAQKGYSRSSTIASFAGFAPAGNPQITVLVIIDEPKTMTHGGELAAPVFSRIVYGTLNYLHVAPDNPIEQTSREWREAHSRPPADRKAG